MRSVSKLFSPHSRASPAPVGFLFARRKSSRRQLPPYPSSSLPSLYQKITEIVAADPSCNFSVPIHAEDTTSIPTVRRNAPENKITSQNTETGNTRLKVTDMEEISVVVHKVTGTIRAENTEISMEQRLDELGITFTADIVEKVLKRCFKVGNLALRFFYWVKLQLGFHHTTETYNTMMYIAGEAEEFDMMERLMEEMDADLCAKGIKTWTILISQYANAKKIGKALWTFEAMSKSGCKPDSGVYEVLLRGLFSAREAELAFEFYKEMGILLMQGWLEKI